MDWFWKFLSGEGFVPRWRCGAWSDLLGWTTIVSDLVIWACYAAIPVILIYFIRRKRDIPFPRIFWLFGAFIFGCGTVHLVEAIIFWVPIYPVSAVVKLITALVSFLTVVALMPIVPVALTLRTPAELEKEVQERKRAQDELKRAQDSLEEKVRARTAELVESNARLEAEIRERAKSDEARQKVEEKALQGQKLESLGVLAGGIAHDFNNLLTVMLGHADLAVAQTSNSSPARQNLAQIQGTAIRAAELCKQLLAYSGKGRFVIQPLNLSILVKEMTDLMEVSVSRRCTLRFNLAEDLPAIEADATQMRQIIMNLLINASEAIGDKVGVITIQTGGISADAAYLKQGVVGEDLPPGRFVFIEIADTGGGMDEATQKRMFDPFFTTKFTGRGLGLSAVMGIVRGHKGALRVNSQMGRGTTIRILLPVTHGDAEPAKRASQPAENWRTSGTVLLVDDDPAVLQVAKQMLETIGLTVLSARNGAEALDVYNQHHDIRFVLMDLTMPVMDGETAFRELRRINPRATVILSSGYSEQEAIDRFAGKGLAGFLQKPYQISTLVAKVRSVVENPLNRPGESGKNPENQPQMDTDQHR